jgi:hypothetical protein
MSDVFRKTTLGYEEIVSRANGLPPRLRRCLIMIDGKRSMLELMRLLPSDDLASIVQSLELEGYIELIGNSPDPIPSQSQVQLNMDTVMQGSQLGKDFEDSQPLFTDSSGQLRRPLPFKERKLRASRVINELLGPNAEGIALKIEATQDAAQLETVLRMAAAFVHDAVNPIAAKRFKDHVRLADAG